MTMAENIHAKPWFTTNHAHEFSDLEKEGQHFLLKEPAETKFEQFNIWIIIWSLREREEERKGQILSSEWSPVEWTHFKKNKDS